MYSGRPLMPRVPSARNSCPNFEAMMTDDRSPGMARASSSSFVLGRRSLMSPRNGCPIPGAVQGAQGLRLIRRTVCVRHPHATQPEAAYV